MGPCRTMGFVAMLGTVEFLAVVKALSLRDASRAPPIPYVTRTTVRMPSGTMKLPEGGRVLPVIGAGSACSSAVAR